jgi:hypothetical protein
MDYAVLHSPAMAPKERVLTIRVDERLSNGLRTVEARDGTKTSDQVRRALETYLEERGAIKAERLRVTARKRS